MQNVQDAKTANILDRFGRWAVSPVDIASLAMFRILFGTMMCLGTVRYLLSGWIEYQYVQPRFFFKYYGFEFVQVWPEWGVYLHFSLLAVVALFVAIGLFYRLSIILFFLGFSYVQLMDVTNYLNHYYLICLLSLLMIFLPMNRAWSIDALRKPNLRSSYTPMWCVGLLRFQMCVVYFYAGLAKLGEDWLLHAQPLGIWMTARNETWLIGPLLDEVWVAYFMSWAGFLYDTGVWLLLLIRPTRLFAYLILIAFHVLTLIFFNIGMFPFIMVISALIFFPPSWPRSLAALFRRSTPERRLSEQLAAGAYKGLQFKTWLSKLGLVVLVVYCVFQLVFPLRHYLYPGNVLWNEQGMRFAWKVLVREKNGAITYHVSVPEEGRRWQISPSTYLLPRQESEMSGQPDLILQLAHHIAEETRKEGFEKVEVRAEARVSLNGRQARLMIDPEVDLARIDDGLGVADWILPGPDGPPLSMSGGRGG